MSSDSGWLYIDGKGRNVSDHELDAQKCLESALERMSLNDKEFLADLNLARRYVAEKAAQGIVVRLKPVIHEWITIDSEIAVYPQRVAMHLTVLTAEKIRWDRTRIQLVTNSGITIPQSCDWILWNPMNESIEALTEFGFYTWGMAASLFRGNLRELKLEKT